MMPVQRFLSIINGIKTAITAITASTGVADGGKIVATDPTTGKLDMSFMPSGVGAETDTIVADVGGLAAGDIVNIYSNGGTLTARKADASTEGKPAHGFVTAAVIAGNNATVHRPNQTLTGLTGLTVGSEYYLSATTAGLITTTIPTATGNVVQSVGIAMSATSLAFNPSEAITLA
jgi:hypothetical protein